MTDPQVALLMLGLFIVFVFLGFPIAFTLMAMGIGFGYYAYFDEGRMWRGFNRLDETATSWESWSLWLEGFYNNRIFDLFINQTFTVMSNEVLPAVPLFLFMGYIVERSNIVDRLFTTLNIASKNIPGSMGVAALITCALFATATGIVGAVVTLMGLLALPAMLKARYNPSFASGIICAGGTLGILIPPSIMLIVYGVVAQVSISRLFIAGIVPGVMIIAIFMTYVAIRSSLNPSLAPKPDRHLSFGEKLWASRFLIPVMGLIFVVLGSIYGGFATPTEAATIGVIGALVLAAVSRSLTWDSFMESLMGAVRTSCMIAFILAGAAFLSIAMGFTGVPRVLAGYVDAWNLSPFALIALLTVLYIFLGCFLDGVSMMVLTAAVVLPMVEKAGIDLLWFGIFTVIVVEMAQITPPVGFNLFVLQGMTGRDILKVTKAAMPFFALMLLGILIITLVPEIVLAPVQFMLSK